MASRQIVCAGCLKAVKGRKYVKCSVCVQTYDLECANIPEKHFTNNLISIHDWKCELCKSKEPRSDNTNTPIRGIKIGNRPEGATGSTNPEPVLCDNETQFKLQHSTAERSYDESMVKAIKDQIMAAVKLELPSLLAAVMKAALEPIRNDIQGLKELQQSMVVLSGNQEEMKKSIDVLGDVNNQLTTENRALRSAVTDLSDRLNNMEQHLRDNNLEIHGIPEHRSENISIMLQQCANVVNHQLSSADIVNCTRVAKLNKDSKLPRTIIVKFKSVGRRDEFYSAVHRYNKSHPKEKLNTSLLGYAGNKVPVYVSEHLSPLNKALHAEARKRAKAASYTFVWVRNGRIYARKDTNSQYIHIKNTSSLDLIK